MNKLKLLAVVAVALAVAVLVPAANADTLHGFCSGVGQCIDNGTNSPTTTNPPANFGFTGSPGGSGAFDLVFLVPNNEDPTPGALSFAVTGTFAGTATLFSSTAWTTGQLDSYLTFPVSASPTNPIGAFLPSTQALDPGATGYYVYDLIDNGTVTLTTSSGPTFNLSAGTLPLASYVVGFSATGTPGEDEAIGATANSGAIFEDGTPPVPTPEPSTSMLMGFGLLGLVGLRRKQIFG